MLLFFAVFREMARTGSVEGCVVGGLGSLTVAASVGAVVCLASCCSWHSALAQITGGRICPVSCWALAHAVLTKESG